MNRERNNEQMLLKPATWLRRRWPLLIAILIVFGGGGGAYVYQKRERILQSITRILARLVGDEFRTAVMR